tara:strand:+ start:607 stop:855 length:249 start_codon:yes stop_codon:yes gene_type:complete
MKAGNIIAKDGQSYLVQSAEKITLEMIDGDIGHFIGGTIESLIVGVKYNLTPLSDEDLERIKQSKGGKLVYSMEHLYREESA